MYHAKEQGRNNYQFYAQSMNAVALQRLILEGKLRRALERDEFEVHYQPKVSLATGALVAGLEALVRWRDPELGMVLPGDFIPIAEETGLIVPLGDWVARAVLRGPGRAGASAACRSVPIAVNLSAHQFRSGDAGGRWSAALRARPAVAPQLLELEITESMLMPDETRVVAALEALRARGVRVAIDDFGTGYSSLAYLRTLPVDTLKIDRSFVRDIAENAGDAALTAAIVSMGARAAACASSPRASRPRPSASSCAASAATRCRATWFAHPMPADDLERWWRATGLGVERHLRAVPDPDARRS